MPRESFSRELQVAAARSACWEALTDVERVADWVAVVDDVREIGRLSSYSALLADRVGPFSMRADLDIEVISLVEGEMISFRAAGEDRQVSSKLAVEATMRLAQSDSGTLVSVDGYYQVTGRVASLGSSWITLKATMILEEFFQAVGRELT
jgi:carbon monoxide dehydrogenase subunit G